MNGDKVGWMVDVDYFKENGKWYTSTTVRIKAKALNSGPYMNDIIDEMSRLRYEEQLPGLQSGKWDGPILIRCDEGYPHLLMPVYTLETVQHGP
jgi:hypothetical protein